MIIVSSPCPTVFLEKYPLLWVNVPDTADTVNHVHCTLFHYNDVPERVEPLHCSLCLFTAHLFVYETRVCLSIYYSIFVISLYIASLSFFPSVFPSLCNLFTYLYLLFFLSLLHLQTFCPSVQSVIDCFIVISVMLCILVFIVCLCSQLYFFAPFKPFSFFFSLQVYLFINLFRCTVY